MPKRVVIAGASAAGLTAGRDPPVRGYDANSRRSATNRTRRWPPKLGNQVLLARGTLDRLSRQPAATGVFGKRTARHRRVSPQPRG
jgi:hypothetical protein